MPLKSSSRNLLVLGFIPWVQIISPHSSLSSFYSWPRQLSVQVGALDCSEGTVFYTQVATSGEEHRRGLSGRWNPLALDEGMLFVFEKPKAASFWMKETYIPLSILYFGPDGRLLSSFEMSIEADPATPQK